MTDIALSRAEVEALCLKAARGAGMEWGLAEEAGFAAGWLAARGIDAAAELLDHLTQNADGWPTLSPIPAPVHWAASGAQLCPIALGAALSDRTSAADGPCAAPLTTATVHQPILVIPFLAACVKAGDTALALRCGEISLLIDALGAPFEDLARLSHLRSAALSLHPMPATPRAIAPTALPRIAPKPLPGLRRWRGTPPCPPPTPHAKGPARRPATTTER